MTQEKTSRFREPGDGSGLEKEDTFYREELQLALRNRGMPLEGLRYPITPTGMHYLLTHFDVPGVDVDAWRLEVGGLVERPLSLTLEDLRSRPARTLPVTMECAGNGRALLSPRPLSQPWLLEAVGTAEWRGASLREVLDAAGVRAEAVELVFTGLDRGVQGEEVQVYQRSLPVAEAMRAEVLLAYEMNGRPLEPQHGHPLRLLVPGWYGMTSVKWLAAIDAVAQPFQGYQMVHSYRYAATADEPGAPVNVIRVRALMIPPGIPDFMTRTRLVEQGDITIIGRAWAGRAAVERVDVSVDGGATWGPADLEEPVSAYAWRGWSCRWRAKSGRYTLSVRATDEDGHTQPFEQFWTYHGMGNNMCQRVDVIVE